MNLSLLLNWWVLKIRRIWTTGLPLIGEFGALAESEPGLLTETQLIATLSLAWLPSWPTPDPMARKRFTKSPHAMLYDYHWLTRLVADRSGQVVNDALFLSTLIFIALNKCLQENKNPIHLLPKRCHSRQKTCGTVLCTSWRPGVRWTWGWNRGECSIQPDALGRGV